MNLDDIPTPITEAIWKQKGGVDVDDMIDLERKLHVARTALQYCADNHHEGAGEFENTILKALELSKP